MEFSLQSPLEHNAHYKKPYEATRNGLRQPLLPRCYLYVRHQCWKFPYIAAVRFLCLGVASEMMMVFSRILCAELVRWICRLGFRSADFMKLSLWTPYYSCWLSREQCKQLLTKINRFLALLLDLCYFYIGQTKYFEYCCSSYYQRAVPQFCISPNFEKDNQSCEREKADWLYRMERETLNEYLSHTHWR